MYYRLRGGYSAEDITGTITTIGFNPQDKTKAWLDEMVDILTMNEAKYDPSFIKAAYQFIEEK